MDLTKTEYKIRCEMGACKNLAAATIKMSRVGIRSRIHICKNCMIELYDLIGSKVVPKSLETLRKKDDNFIIAEKTSVTANETCEHLCDIDEAKKEVNEKIKIKKQKIKN